MNHEPAERPQPNECATTDMPLVEARKVAMRAEQAAIEAAWRVPVGTARCGEPVVIVEPGAVATWLIADGLAVAWREVVVMPIVLAGVAGVSLASESPRTAWAYAGAFAQVLNSAGTRALCAPRQWVDAAAPPYWQGGTAAVEAAFATAERSEMPRARLPHPTGEDKL